MTTLELEEITAPMTAADRCDACGAQAVIAARFTVNAESALRFCGHHANRHRDAMATEALKVWAVTGKVLVSRDEVAKTR
jgi:hypothetical protein